MFSATWGTRRDIFADGCDYGCTVSVFLRDDKDLIRATDYERTFCQISNVKLDFDRFLKRNN